MFVRGENNKIGVKCYLSRGKVGEIFLKMKNWSGLGILICILVVDLKKDYYINEEIWRLRKRFLFFLLVNIRVLIDDDKVNYWFFD